MKKKNRYSKKEVADILDGKVDKHFNGSIASMGRHFGVTRVQMGNVIRNKRSPSIPMVRYATEDDELNKFSDVYYAKSEDTGNEA